MHFDRVADKQVVVVHPVHQHSYESAVAAYEAGLLYRFYTGVYTPDSALRAIRSMTGTFPSIKMAEQVLARRSHPDLPSRKVRRLSSQHWVALGAAHLRTPLHGRNPRLTALVQRTFDLRVARCISRKRHGIGLLHAFDLQSPFTLQRAHAIGIPTILDVTIAHTAAWSWDTKGLPDHPARATLDAERAASDWLLVGSTVVRNEVVAEGVDPSRILILPYGADPALFRPPEAERLKEVLFVGQLSRRKGLDVLLEAWRNLGPCGYRLILVGTPDADGLRLLRTHDDVTVVPHVTRQEVADRMRNASLFVLPSRAEGSALVIYEAMASGLPVVTTDAAGSVIRDGIDGCLVDPEPQAVARIMDQILSDPSRSSELGKQARETIVNNYTWRHYRTRLASVYASVLAGAEPILDLSVE